MGSPYTMYYHRVETSACQETYVRMESFLIYKEFDMTTSTSCLVNLSRDKKRWP